MSEASRSGQDRIVCVVGARPNLMKAAPLIRAFRRLTQCDVRLVHTGQHYDHGMSDALFEDLGLASPDAFLGVGSGSHAAQTGRLFLALEPVLDELKPDLVLVLGDVNSTLAASLVAVKKLIPVAHVEAGLRSFDRTMPEEINRIVTDQVSDLLFVTEPDALANLRREGIPDERVFLVGNVMIDSLLDISSRARAPAETFATHHATPVWAERAAREGYAFLTLHRPANVDDRAMCEDLLSTIRHVSDLVPLLFALHPRTRKAIETHQLTGLLDHPFLFCTEALSYRETVGIVAQARVVLTDSGGLQEETTGLGVTCLTLRPNTERPITVREGTNRVIGTDRARILAEVEDILTTGGKSGHVPALWDGKAAERIVAHIAAWLETRRLRRRPDGTAAVPRG